VHEVLLFSTLMAYKVGRSASGIVWAVEATQNEKEALPKGRGSAIG
jgi:hypothetical protein